MLIDRLDILRIAVVIGDARKPANQISGKQQRGHYGDRSRSSRDCTHRNIALTTKPTAPPGMCLEFAGEMSGNIYTRSTKLSTTFFSPARSNAMVSLLPST